jgi:putative FmdB family regulatory protein
VQNRICLDVEGRCLLAQGSSLAERRNVLTTPVATAQQNHLPTPHASILIEQYRSPPVPIFEYICEKCHHRFEALVYGNQKAECPKCRGTKLEPQLSVFAVSAKSSSTASAASGPCGSCGDPRGPGACSLGDMN